MFVCMLYVLRYHQIHWCVGCTHNIIAAGVVDAVLPQIIVVSP